MENQPLLIPTHEHMPSDSGYSETEQVKIIEGSTVDIKIAKKRKPLIIVSRQEKIFAEYQKTHDTILLLLKSLEDLQDNPRHQEKALEEIKSLRVFQDELLHSLLLEQRGELTQQTASQAVWNLIK